MFDNNVKCVDMLLQKGNTASREVEQTEMDAAEDTAHSHHKSGRTRTKTTMVDYGVSTLVCFAKGCFIKNYLGGGIWSTILFDIPPHVYHTFDKVSHVYSVRHSACPQANGL